MGTGDIERRWIEHKAACFKGRVPIVVLDKPINDRMASTVRHNRARGTHLLEPMKNIIKKLLDNGQSVKEIAKQLGMKPEEVFRLSDFSRDEFLDMLIKQQEFTKARLITSLPT